LPKQITIAGLDFDLPSAEEVGIVQGYICDEAAARHLYQTWCDRIRNNLTPIIKKFRAQQVGEQAIRDHVAEYAAHYKFSLLGRQAASGNGAADAQLQAEIGAIARDYIKQYLAEQGRTLADISDGQLIANLERVASNPATIKMAKRRLAERRRTAASLLEGVNL